MFDIRFGEASEIILEGRLDASQVDKAKEFFARVTTSSTMDFKGLQYISSAGLGVLLAAQKKLTESGQKLKIRGMNDHIRDVFRYARFDLIFDIEP